MTQIEGSAVVKPGDGRPTLLQLGLALAKIALTSFGGGVSGWMMREFVYDRKWLTRDEFLGGLAICQAMPGVNVANLAIWFGFRLRGIPGAIVGLFAIIIPSATVVILMATAFAALAGFEATHFALAGAAAAAIGLSLSMGIEAARAVPRKLVPLGVLVGTFVAIGIFRLPLVWTVLVAGTIGVLHAYLTPRGP